MFGWQGRIARIDLTTGKWEVEEPPPSLLHRFIGGRGLGGHLLAPFITRTWDDPAMPVILLTGPLVGTASPTSGRMVFMSRSPLTGTVTDASVGGTFGTAMKNAGFDGLMITGKAPRLCGIEITDNRLVITDASALAGQGTTAVFQILKTKGSLAAVGPAAENRVLFANIMVDGHFAVGRNGLGLVFAEKNLKYITVSGHGRTAVKDAALLRTASQDIYRLVSASPALSGRFGISNFGTAALYDLMDSRHMMPTRNFRKTRFSHAPAMNAHAYHRQYNPVRTGCRGCHIRCKQRSEKGLPLPEFETMSHFSALLENERLETVMEANRICNDLGMDTISAAATLACHSEILDKRLSPDLIPALLADIGYGRTPGRLLGQGSARYARACRRPEAAMTVKNLELSAYDPRGAYGMALAFAVSNRGACHLRAYPISHEILRKPVATNRLSFEGKARIIKISEDLNAVVDSLTACKFIFFAASLEEYAKVFEAVTGMETSAHDLLKTGERIVYQERIMNAANGFDDKDDDLPGRFFEADGDRPPIDRRAFLTARANYYLVRGLDPKGRPTRDKAAELGLDRLFTALIDRRKQDTSSNEPDV
ncbi:MAG: aldehyde ferredoxin oxidoreductase family protein [Thermodesulfobacteriota bacterium]